MSLLVKVQHPAAKMLVMASHMQEQEVGDGTNFVLVFAGVLLELAEDLLRMGLSVSEASYCYYNSHGLNSDCHWPIFLGHNIVNHLLPSELILDRDV